MKKKSIFALLLAVVFLFQAILPAYAGSGNLNISAYGMNLKMPYSLYINEDKDSQATLPGQNIKTTKGDKETTRQSVVGAPAEGGKFDFNAIFKIDQRSMWGYLVKPTDAQVQGLPATRNAGVDSYVDLIVRVDERVTPAETISGYFDSYTWRPVFVFDKDYNLLNDVRASYVAGQNKTSFTFPSQGKTEYIVRVVPIRDANSNLDKPLRFGFDDEGNTNFTISKEAANEIAAARRGMSEADLEKEKAIVEKRNQNLTADEIAFLKKYNIYTAGEPVGRVTGEINVIFRTIRASATLDNQVVPAGIAVAYENIKLRFLDSLDENKLSDPYYAGYNESVDTNSVPDQTFPADPTKEGYTFVGWAKTKGATEADFDKNEVLTDDISLYAVWKANVKVIFDENYPGGNEKLKEATLEAGTKITAENMPANPERDNHVFLGWAKDKAAQEADQTQPTAETVIEENTTYYAIWAEAVAVTFDKNYEGATDKEVTKAVAKGQALGEKNVVADPTRDDGYVFKGWAKEANATKEAVISVKDEVINEATTFYAVWVKQVNVKFYQNDLEEGSNPDTSRLLHSEVVEKGNGLANLPENPTREGYTFKGWGGKVVGTNEVVYLVIQPSENTRFEEDANYYAFWEKAAPQEITLSYAFKNGNASTPSYPNLPEDVIPRLPNVESKRVQSGSTVTKDTIQPISYFVDLINQANLTSELQDSNGEMRPVVWRVDKNHSAGHAYRDTVNNTNITDEYSVENAIEDIRYVISLMPYEQITVKFDKNYGNENTVLRSETIDSGDALEALPESPVRDGYTFEGWGRTRSATKADEVQVQPEDTYSEDTVFYAIWTENDTTGEVGEKVKVSFDKNYDDASGNKIVQETSIDKGGSLKVLPQNPSREGYTFEGWSKQPNGTKADKVEVNLDDTYSEDTVFYAIWTEKAAPPKAKEIKVSFDKNDGSTESLIQENIITSGTSIEALPKAPERDGYTFLGWSKDKSVTIADRVQPQLEDSYQEDTVFYAIWKQNVASNGGGGSSAIPVPTPSILAKTPDALNSVDHMHYIVGYPDKTVRPNKNITRAEITSVYYRLLNDKKRDEIFTKTNGFKDVKATNWYNKAVSSMTNGKYISGYPDGTFGGNKPMTRAEFVAVTARFLDKKASNKTFVDVKENHWAKDAISAGVAYGWLSGYEDGTFRPDQAITRAEAMAIINRLLDRGVDENGLKQVDYKKWVDNEKGKWYYYEVIEATHDHKYTGKRPSEVWTSLKIERVYDYDKYEKPEKLA